jgi:class 3 adenylate cyclase
LVFAACAASLGELRLRAEVDVLVERLVSVASEAAGRMDAEQHEQIRSPEDASSSFFESQRRELRRVQDGYRHLLQGTDVYTLRRSDGAQACEFVVMTNPEPFIGAPYDCIPAMDAAWAGEKAGSGLYRSPNGVWISGFAPLLSGDRVVGIVEVDRPAADLASARTRSRLLALIFGLLGAGLGAALPGTLSLAEGPRRVFHRIVFGRLAVRIGLGGALAVVVAVSIVGVLDHREDRRRVVESMSSNLLTIVKIGAERIDATLHVQAAEGGDAESDAFRVLRDELRRLQASSGLSTPVYTMRRDGELLRFVVMTNEVPFVGDAYELRDGHRRSFAEGVPGAEGPYIDAHGTWMSAWAPVIGSNGEVVAVLQADREMSVLLDLLSNAALQRLLFALLGIGVAFGAAGVVGRGIARPVARVAAAAAQVGGGDYAIEVPEDRQDEVGELARAVAVMARGLEEKERLRDMFGKYMAGQVAQELLGRGELSLEGEEQEITVVLSDIRGYTALTEELGAAEVVQLLNEYFTILVDAVIANEGVVDKFMGDAMLCWFGAPVPQADHAERALRAARSMMEEVSRWNLRRVRSGLAPVATGVGVASGKVVVGNIGSQRRLEYTAIGDAVNLASRLCSKAAEGEILASAAVCARTPEVQFEALGPMDIKGVSEPVEVGRLMFPTVAETLQKA